MNGSEAKKTRRDVGIFKKKKRKRRRTWKFSFPLLLTGYNLWEIYLGTKGDWILSCRPKITLIRSLSWVRECISGCELRRAPGSHFRPSCPPLCCQHKEGRLGEKRARGNRMRQKPGKRQAAGELMKGRDERERDEGAR